MSAISLAQSGIMIGRKVTRLTMLMQLKLVPFACYSPIFLFLACFFNFQIGGPMMTPEFAMATPVSYMLQLAHFWQKNPFHHVYYPVSSLIDCLIGRARSVFKNAHLQISVAVAFSARDEFEQACRLRVNTLIPHEPFAANAARQTQHNAYITRMYS